MAKDKKLTIWYRFARLCCKVFCHLVFKMKLSGTENVPKEGAFLLVSNHQSFLDPLLCGTPIKRHMYYLARDSLFRNPFFGRLISSIDVLPIKRGHADLGAVKKIISKLRQGSGVCLFPEATRTSDGKIAELKPGFGILCKRGKAAIVPMVIDGAFECWPRHKKMFTKGAQITVTYGEMISFEQIKQMDERQLAEHLTNVLREIQSVSRSRNGKKPYDYS